MGIYVSVSCRNLGADAYIKNGYFYKFLDKRNKPLLHLKQLGHIQLVQLYKIEIITVKN